MNQLALGRAERMRYPLAIASGLLLAAAFPKFGVAGLAWLAPGLMLATALGVGGAASFRLGYAAGLALHLTSLYWLLCIPVSVAPVFGWLALAAYLALFQGAWVWLCWKIYPAEISVDAGGIMSSFDRFLASPFPQRLGWAVGCAALWVALEMVQGRLFTGFPWNFAGASQYQLLPVIQMAAVTGVYGVSFSVVWFSVSLFCALLALTRQPERRWRWQRELILPLVVLAAIFTLGWEKITQPVPGGPTLEIALIQPSIPQKWVWDSAESSRRFEQLLELSRRALTNGPDLLVWPEAAVPYMVRWDEEARAAVTNLVRTHQVWLVLGSDDAELRARPDGGRETNYFNSSFLVRPDGELAASYHKRRLVIFGEYYPLKKWLPFLNGLGEFTPGSKPVRFYLPELKMKTSVLICFEDIFPHLTREYVEDDTDFLLNLTNNGWFGESAAQWQHAASAVFRAVENGLPLVRCANNGLTCWVDAQGRLNDVYFAGSRDIYQAGFKIVRVPLLGGQTRAPTFYHRHGDWFGWGCVGLGLAAVVRRIILRYLPAH